MYWVIQDNLYNEDGFKLLIGALERLDIEHSIHKVIPFVRELTPDFDTDAERVIVMGSYSLAHIAQKKGWEPGSFVDNLNYELQLEHWGSEMLNWDATICRFEDVGDFETPRFMRPVDDGKAFSGQVFDCYEMNEWRRGVLEMPPDELATLTGDTAVMVCPLKKIYRETRTWIVKGQVITASGYKMGSRVGAFDPDPEVIRYAQTRANQWSPNEAYCMDIALTENGLKIVEINNLNSSGFYGADMMKLVIELEAAFST